MGKRPEYRPGPRPIVTLFILLGAILAMGAAFAAIKVFLLDGVQQQGIIQESGFVDVYFCRQEDCGKEMTSLLIASNRSMCLFYELNRFDIIKTLNAESTKTLVFDKNAGKVEGLKVQPVPSDGLMHNKFCILDGRTVITGSTNPTMNDIERNDNNLLVIESPTLAKRYTQELEEHASRLSRSYEKLPAHPVAVNISGTLVEQRFCPQEDCEGVIVRRIQQAQSSINFMIFTFTSDPIGDAMLLAQDRNVTVRGVFEKRQIDDFTEYPSMLAAGADVRIDGNKYTMHHKVIIIDNRTVITGSFNPTKSANERNDENLLIIDDPVIAQEYLIEFERVWGQTNQSSGMTI
jgi:phosphatidylserine/phosphatidylglycerophosphate/cardiolipin synthase-like enzyme